MNIGCELLQGLGKISSTKTDTDMRITPHEAIPRNNHDPCLAYKLFCEVP